MGKERKLGKIREYPQGYTFTVEDENGNEIPCNTEVEAKILSLLLEM